MRHGKGVLYHNNKKIYDGEFKNGKYDGNGILYFENDYYYVGEFKNDLMEGDGIVYDKNGKENYKGKFSNNEPKDSYFVYIFKKIFKK